MPSSNALRLALLISFLIVFQAACQFTAGAHTAKQKMMPQSQGNVASTSSRSLSSKSSLESDAFETLVVKQWSADNFDWLEKEAARLRVSKERLPGGYWKLRSLFRTLEYPVVPKEATDADWEAHIAKLERWVKLKPASITPQVLLVHAWESYAWKGRGTGFSNTVTDEGWKKFEERLEKASRLLNESARLEEKCPEWYLAALAIARSEGWKRDEMEHIFAEGTALEPTYYYLHQAKAGFLLPRWYGNEGEWEQFAETAANRVGGEQGDVLFFAIYSNMMSYHGLEFMNTHQKEARRLLSGFRAIEKLYGPSPKGLNEAALISFFANDPETTAELMKRIGDDFDESVWRSKSNFDVFKQGAAEALKRQAAQPPKPQVSGGN